MLKNCYFFLLIQFCISGLYGDISIKSPSAILINGETGTVLFEKRAHEERFPASITKIATCALALEMAGDKLSTEIAAVQDCIGAVSEDEKRKKGYTQPAHWLVFDACHIGIKRGEILSLKDLIYGMMVASADDASNIIAYHLAGSIPKFMDLLNEKLPYWGCKKTYFANPHGLHHPTHKSTPYDMAMIAKHAMTIPLFREIVTTTSCKRPKTNKQEPTTLVQTNRLLKKGKFRYTPCIGIKTGYTSDAKHCLVAAAEKNGRMLISVVMGAPEKDIVYEDTIALFESAFSETKQTRTLFQEGLQSFQLKTEKFGVLSTELKKSIQISYYPHEEEKVSVQLHWETLPQELHTGDIIGHLSVVNEKNHELFREPLYVAALPKKSWYQKIELPPISLKLSIGAAILIVLLLISWRYKRAH